MENFFRKAEPYFFYLLVLLHCIPIFLFRFFVTHDGPAHVYNAYLIKSMVIHSDALTADFFSLRSFPEPNWTGHAFMALVSFLFSPLTAERILLLSYVVLFPIAFRKSILLTNQSAPLLSYFIFPFVYSYAFYGGLYNFMLGMPLLLFAILFLLKKMLPLRTSDYLFIFFISMLLYFSHLLIFGIFVLLASFILFLKSRIFFPVNVETESRNKMKLLKNIFPATLMMLPAILLSIKFLFEKISFHTITSAVASGNLLLGLISVIPTITLDDKIEFKYGLTLGILFIFLLITTLAVYWKNRKNNPEKTKGNFSYSFFWISASMLMLTFYFIIPDNFATGGVVKVRFSYFFFLFLILWISTQKLSLSIVRITVAITVVLTLTKFYYFLSNSKRLSKDAEVYYSATELIEPNSIVLPLNYSSNWMHSNLSNYLGTNKHIVILDNYEAGREHFPLVWKENRNPVQLLGSFNGDAPLCANVSAFENATSKKVDYIILWKYDHELKDVCSLEIQSAIKKNYQLVFKSFDKQLYMYRRLNQKS